MDIDKQKALEAIGWRLGTVDEFLGINTQKPKLFKVLRICYPEWGKSTVEWTKYFLAKDRNIVESHLIREYGDLKKYYDYDRAEVVIEIEEIPEIHNLFE